MEIAFWIVIISLLIIVIFGQFRIYIKIPTTKARKNWLLFWKKEKAFDVADYEAFVYQLAHALRWMSNQKVGALVVIEKEKSLNDFVALGYQIKARLSSELLITIFGNKNSALHDGGVIIRGLHVVSAASYFPVTQTKLITTLGARHRAAAGLTENSDAIAFAVSETTGKVTYSIKGKLHEIYSGDINSMAGKIFELLNFYID